MSYIVSWVWIAPFYIKFKTAKNIIGLKRHSNEINIYFPFEYYSNLSHWNHNAVFFTKHGSGYTSKTKAEIVKYSSCFTYIPCHPLGASIFIGLYFEGRREQSGIIKVVKL